MDTDRLTRLAATYSAHTGLKLSTLGNYSVNDGKIFDRWEKGGTCTFPTGSKMVLWFSDHWPEDLTWPKDIQRPSKRRNAA